MQPMLPSSAMYERSNFAASRSRGVFLVRVAELAHVRMAEERVVVEADLRVEGDDVAALGHDEGVDLHERRIELDERAGERGQERHRLRELLFLAEPEAEREPPRLVAREPDDGIDRLAEDLLGRLRRDLLDLDAALRRRHHRSRGRPRGRPRCRGRARARSCSPARRRAASRRGPAAPSGA
jgi:hypothetical protein